MERVRQWEWMVMGVWSRLLAGGDPARGGREEGFSTAELLGNAALAIGALVAIWLALKAMGLDLVSSIATKLKSEF